MKHPKGAVRTTQQMEKLLGKTIYLTLPPEVGREIPRVSPFIVKLTPVKIEIIKRPNRWNNLFHLHTAEYVDAAQDHAIATYDDWAVSWGNWGDENMRSYYFANYWCAYAHALRLQEYVQCC